MRDKSSTELFEIVRRAFVFTAPHVVDAALALTEIEERWFSGRTQATPAPAPEQAPAPAPPQHFGPHTPQSVLARLTRLEENSHKPVDFSPMLARLTRVEEDLAAFKREHAGHRHTTLGDVQVGTTRPTLFGEDRDTQGMHNAADAARETSTESLLNTRSRLYKKDPASPGVLKYVGTTEAREPTWSRPRRGGAERPPPRLYALSGEQARLLREAHAKPEGVYLSACGTPGSSELLEGGAAAVREEHRWTRGVHDDRPCEWTERYLIPTARGLELLAEHGRREVEEKERKRAADAKRYGTPLECTKCGHRHHAERCIARMASDFVCGCEHQS